MRARAGHPRPEPDVEPLPGEHLQRLARDPPVRRGKEVVERFQDRHLGAEPPPYAAELQADDPGSDDAKPLRNLGEREGAFVVDDPVSIDLRDRDTDGNRSGGDDDVPRGQAPSLVGAVQGHRDSAASLQGSKARDRLDLVLAQQAGDPAGQGLHHLVLAREHPAQIERHVAGLDAVRGQQVAQVVVVVRGVEQGLRGDAADVQAGAAQGRLSARIEPSVHAGGAQPELRGPDRRDVSAGTGPDDYDVEGVHGVLSRVVERFGIRNSVSTD